MRSSARTGSSCRLSLPPDTRAAGEGAKSGDAIIVRAGRRSGHRVDEGAGSRIRNHPIMLAFLRIVVAADLRSLKHVACRHRHYRHSVRHDQPLSVHLDLSDQRIDAEAPRSRATVRQAAYLGPKTGTKWCVSWVVSLAMSTARALDRGRSSRRSCYRMTALRGSSRRARADLGPYRRGRPVRSPLALIGSDRQACH